MDYYSFTDPEVMEGWVGHVGWSIADGVTRKWSPFQLAVWRRIGKVRRPRPAFYPLYPLAVWCSGNALVSINAAVALHRARLVLGWVTAFGQVNYLIT